jgi:ubiquinone/menaquinone biosynthesis C-methylase UbiE
VVDKPYCSSFSVLLFNAGIVSSLFSAWTRCNVLKNVKINLILGVAKIIIIRRKLWSHWLQGGISMRIFIHRRGPESFKRLYNWFHLFYGILEKSISNTLRKAVAVHVAGIAGIEEMTAVEYGCGTGILTAQVAPLCKKVSARDISGGMLRKARARASRMSLSVEFSEGNLLEINEPDNSYDLVLLSFVLHLFTPAVQERILANLLRVARKKVIIIEHSRKWDPLTAFIEWMEGSYYELFIRMDFHTVAARINAKEFEEDDRQECLVLKFTPDGT